MIISLLVFIALEVASLIIWKKSVHNFIDTLIKNNFNLKSESRELERRKTGKSKSKREKKRKRKKSRTSLSSKKKKYKAAPNKKRKKISIDEISPSAFNTKEKMNDKNIIINNINILNNNNDITFL